MALPIAKTVDFKPGERNVFFHILTGCNLSCQHCYINPAQHGTGSVAGDTIEKWLTLFMDEKKESNVVFLGGEPTMHKDLPRAIKTARKLGYRSVTVDTNGFLLHNFLGKVDPADLDFLSFSLDGPTADINDPIRGPGVFETCTENLRKAVLKGFNVSLIYTVSRRNIDHLHLMPDLLAEWGVKRFFIQVIGIRGKPARNGADKWQLSHREWLDIIPRVAAASANQGITVTYPKVFLKPGETFECAGRVAENYFIFPNGRVYQCPLCEDYPVNAYRIEDDRLVKNDGILEDGFFTLDIPEGCVINKLLQPDNLQYDAEGKPLYKISCCLLKQEIKKT